MGHKMKFKKLIKRHGAEIEIIDDNKAIQGPRVKEGNQTTSTIEAAVFNLTAREAEYYGGGDYTTQDIKLITTDKLEAETTIEYKNNQYEIDDEQDNTDYVDFYHYVAVKKVVE